MSRRWPLTRGGLLLLGGLLVSLLLAGGVSYLASDAPDGLEYTAGQGCGLDAEGEIVDGTCIAEGERDHELGDRVFADYALPGIDNDVLATGLSGVVGVLVTFALAGGLFWLARRRQPADGTAPRRQPPAGERGE